MHSPSTLASRLRRAGLLFGVVVLCAACAGMWGVSSARRTTSIVEYLYPDQKDAVAEQGIPVLSLPMRVGVAFVPESYGHSTLSEARKSALLEQVASHFRGRDFIKSLEVIPSAYLTPKGGFANLDQLRTMHGIESIALISYDQTQFTDESIASLMYWTIVGAYMVSAEKNDTHTMVDAVVVHIPSRKMLFRAPGVSQVKGSSTLVGLSEELRRDGEKGFDQAVAMMIGNLDQRLADFRETVKNSPTDYRIARQEGYSGSGALGLRATLLLLVLLAAGAWWSRR